MFYSILILTLLVSSVFAQEESFEEFQRRQQQELQEFQEFEEQSLEAAQKEWEKYQDEQEKEWTAYRERIQKMWGEFQESGGIDWVQYDEENASKTEVDFEEGKIKVEVLVEVDEQEEIEEKLEKATEKLLKTSDDKGTVFAEQLPIEEKKEDGKVEFEEKKLEKFVKKEVKEKIEVKPVKSPDGKERIKATVTIKLNSDHISKRAQKYIPLVEKYSAKHNVNPHLVLAIMRNESAFNPVATSTCNQKPCATGLMQLVPWSGGQDAFQALGHEGQPTRKYLQNPENNIELGTKYLSILIRTFDGTNEDEKMRYLITCAYNTGAGNVAKGLVGKRKVRPAVEFANGISSERLYGKLRSDLPYEETRTYLERVTNSYKKYSEMSN